MKKHTKKCTKCMIDKPLAAFSTNKAKKDGLNYVCKECQKSISKRHYEENKQAYLERNRRRVEEAVVLMEGLKKGKVCPFCGENDPCCLDFHHQGNKEYVVSQMRKHSLAKIMKEAEKCVILCSNCHRKLHAGKIKMPP